MIRPVILLLVQDNGGGDESHLGAVQTAHQNKAAHEMTEKKGNVILMYLFMVY